MVEADRDYLIGNHFPGKPCPIKGCNGVLEYEHGGCTCFRNPPCSRCVDSWSACPKCGWTENDCGSPLFWYDSEKVVPRKGIHVHVYTIETTPFAVGFIDSHGAWQNAKTSAIISGVKSWSWLPE